MITRQTNLLASDVVSLCGFSNLSIAFKELDKAVSLCTKRHFDLQRVSHLAVNLTAVCFEARDYGKMSSNRCVTARLHGDLKAGKVLKLVRTAKLFHTRL